MFDIEAFYRDCESGEKVCTDKVKSYVNSFETVIVWGSAGLGQAVGKVLESYDVVNLIYWDMRCDEIGPIGNRKMEKPFESEYNRENTLIFYCIPNHVIMKSLMNELKANGYGHIIRGDIFYSGTICPYCNGDKPSAVRCWMKNECRSVICKRLEMITQNRSQIVKPGEPINLTYNCFIINSMCNLNCTHCVQYINNYPLDKRYNVKTENILRDIDDWLELVDSVGTISVMGGETFMHPDIALIAKRFSMHENFGFVSFPTNGLFPIKPEQLEGIEDPRIVIAFGAYQHVASEQQLEIYEKNIELVKKYSIAYTESRHLPTWIVPSGLYRATDDVEYMTQRKQNCVMPPRNLQIKDGKIYTCDRCVSLHEMGVVDYPSDYYNLQQAGSLEERREVFRRFVDQPYYEVCGHCGYYPEQVLAPSALQGQMDVFSEAAYKDVDWFEPATYNLK